jgi:hypothetical protein
MSTTLEHKMKQIDKHPNNPKVLMDMIFHWTLTGGLTRKQFDRIMEYAQLDVSIRGKKGYKGNEDPESVMG